MEAGRLARSAEGWRGTAEWMGAVTEAVVMAEEVKAPVGAVMVAAVGTATG